MGTKERKIRERESLRKNIIANAYEILMKDGLDGLNMRTIANRIEYSQSKIYEFFESKDKLCEILCKELCEELLEQLRRIYNDKDPEKGISDLILTTMEFHGSHPHSDDLFTLVCFGPQRFSIPEAFLEIEHLFKRTLKNLNSPYLKNDKEITESLDIIRCIFIAVNTLMRTETSMQGRTRALSMVKNAISILVRGWR